MHLGILASHPIQYQAPLFRALSDTINLEVLFAHRPSAQQQAAGFGGAFEWDVDLLTGYNHRFLRNVARRPSSSRFLGCDNPELNTLIRGTRFDAFIVYGWNLKTYWQAVNACHKEKIPVLVRGDSQLNTNTRSAKSTLKQLVYPRLLRQFDGFLAVGRRNEEYLRHYNVPADRIYFTPHCVDNDWFGLRAKEARPKRDAMRTTWGASPQTVVALYVGKFNTKKRPLDLVNALQKLTRSSRQVMAVFVGSGDLEPRLRSAVARSNVRAFFAGFRNQTELPSYYVAADVLVLPSDGGETWGLVVNESMACGLPAIVSDAVGCGPDLVEQGATGFTYKCGDVDALAANLAQVAALRQSGFEFEPHLEARMNQYSIQKCVKGISEAVQHAIRRCAGSRNFG
jgi:glycosyltransferase involved in cell wall biosynthesis